jgi:hypothetical protein
VAWRGCRGALDRQDAVEAEVQLMQRVIAVMVRHEGTLMEMHQLERRQDEEPAAYQARRERERVLIINSSYYLEVPSATSVKIRS